jgi:hypothetical protein
MRRMIPLQVAALLIGGLLPAMAAVFQYSVPVPSGNKTNQAVMWIPPQAKQVRGVIMAGMTLMERECVKDPFIRESCADQQLAIIFMKCGLATDLQTILNDMARVSGYRELSVAPLFFIGHSAGGPQAHDAAVKYSDRCFGMVQYRGGGPWNGEAIASGIPTLMMVGEFDEFGGVMRRANDTGRWEGFRKELAEYRATHENRLASLVVEPGAGHFPWSDRNGKLLALFIRKAAARCIPPAWPVTAAVPVPLLRPDCQSGWLSDLSIKTSGTFEPAAYDAWKGDKACANWHFDKEMVAAVTAYHARGFGKKDQFIKWTDSCWVDAGTRYFFTNPTWVGDGMTFEVHPVYASAYPEPHYDGAKKVIGPQWLEAGQPVGHSTAPIHVKIASGAIAAAGSHTFRICFDALSPAIDGIGRASFMAYSEGDSEYRYTEHVGMLPRSFGGFSAGRDQTITFPPLANMKAHAAPVDLNAKSDAGLPVQYYVAYGPACIEDGRLKITDVPMRATFPIDVKVVAWQFGSGIEPKVKTAKPVEQIIQIEKPPS